MSDKLIFLSHIHEEAAMANIFKEAIESEYAGFVDVFVSSDGASIPAGANFLKKIEDGLIKCTAAMYLISPNSVKRNWINFELGAVWIRSVSSAKSGGPDIPTVPICHSGCTPGNLPMPLNNLNAISGTDPLQLERAFRSIQSAVGGKGALKTDFKQLASTIAVIEQQYMLGVHVKEMLKMLGVDIDALIQHCEKLNKNARTEMKLGFRDQSVIQKLKQYETGQLKGLMAVNLEKPGVAFGSHGAVNGAEASIVLPVSLVLAFKAYLAHVV